MRPEHLLLLLATVSLVVVLEGFVVELRLPRGPRRGPLTRRLSGGSPLEEDEESESEVSSSVGFPVEGRGPTLEEPEGRLERAGFKRTKKAVLSLDGGGLRGLLTARVLEAVERELRAQSGIDDLLLCEAFDVVAGTSTGSVLATYLTSYGAAEARTAYSSLSKKEARLDGSARGAVQVYEAFSKDIFPPTCDWLLNLRALTSGMYGPEGLERTLKECLPPDFTLDWLSRVRGGSSSSEKKKIASLLVTTFDMTYRRAAFFFADRIHGTARYFPLDAFGRPYVDALFDKDPEAAARKFKAIRDKLKTMDDTLGLKQHNVGEADVLRVIRNYNPDLLRFAASDSTSDHNQIPLWQVARCSASAPIYFPPMTIPGFFNNDNPNGGGGGGGGGSSSSSSSETLVACDGGVVANNPAQTALSTLYFASNVHEEDLDLADCMVLSIGCGQKFNTVGGAGAAKTRTLQSWVLPGGDENLLDILMTTNSAIAHNTIAATFASLGLPGNYLRIQLSLNENGRPGGAPDRPAIMGKALGVMDRAEDEYLDLYDHCGTFLADIYADEIKAFVTKLLS